MGLREWWARKRDPEYYALLDFLAELEDPAKFEEMLTAMTWVVNVKPEWDPDASVWFIDVRGPEYEPMNLKVGRKIQMPEGRGGKENEVAKLARSLGDGMFALEFVDA